MGVYEVLEKIGLTTNESKAYMALVDGGSASAGDIAKKADLHRRPTYDALNRLVEKGLVSYTVKQGKKYFHAADPDRILGIIKLREKEINEVLPDLRAKYKATKTKIFSETYEGREGIRAVMEDILREKKEWMTLSSTGLGYKILPYFLEHFAQRRQKLGIKRKSLLIDTKDAREYSKILDKQKLVDYKFLSKDVKNPQTIWIYGDKVAIILVSIEHPVAILIESKEIADFYRDQFNLMWKHS
ncbi:TrmB family transcriptional regulator [Thermoproteota archaeon]